MLRKDRRLRSRRAWRLGGIAVGVIALVATAGVIWGLQDGGDQPAASATATDQPTPDSPTRDPALVRTLYVSPTGTAGPCTLDSPCSLAQSLERAAAADVIGLTSGNYGQLKVLQTKAQRTGSGVVVTAAPGADVQIARLDLYASNLTWRGLTVRGVVYLRGSATNTVLDGMTVDGGGAFVRANDTVVQNSLFENGSSLDGIQIGRASRVRIEGNVVRDYNQNGTSGYHSDCIQVFDAADISITRNRLSSCSNAGIIFSSGAGKGISNIAVESNFIQGCVQLDNACRGGSAVDLREPSTTGAVVRNNTMLDGSVRVGLQPDMIFDRNIVGYLSDCTGPVTNSIIQKWNEGVCKDPHNLSASGNRIQQVQVVDDVGGDLHAVDPSTVRISSFGDTTAAPMSIDGKPLPDDMAGAAT